MRAKFINENKKGSIIEIFKKDLLLDISELEEGKEYAIFNEDTIAWESGFILKGKEMYPNTFIFNNKYTNSQYDYLEDEIEWLIDNDYIANVKKATNKKITNESNTPKITQPGLIFNNLVSDISELEKGKEYAINDPGINEWNDGYIFRNIENKSGRIIFEDDYGDPTEEELITFEWDEFEEMIDKGQVALVSKAKNKPRTQPGKTHPNKGILPKRIIKSISDFEKGKEYGIINSEDDNTLYGGYIYRGLDRDHEYAIFQDSYLSPSEENYIVISIEEINRLIEDKHISSVIRKNI